MCLHGMKRDSKKKDRVVKYFVERRWLSSGILRHVVCMETVHDNAYNFCIATKYCLHVKNYEHGDSKKYLLLCPTNQK
jgi:hypothetical protein